MESLKQLEQNVVDQKGQDYWDAKKARSIQGAALVGVGVLLVLGAFALAIILLLKGMDLTLMSLALPGGALVAGILVLCFGATFWSGEVVGTVLRSVLPFVKKG